MQDDSFRTTVRMPHTLRTALQKTARHNGRSLNNQIVQILIEYYVGRDAQQADIMRFRNVGEAKTPRV